MSPPRTRVTAGKASLVGGIVVGIATMLLCVGVTHELGFYGPAVLGAGLVASVALAVWIRIADL